MVRVPGDNSSALFSSLVNDMMASNALVVRDSARNQDGVGCGVVVSWHRMATANHLGLLVAD